MILIISHTVILAKNTKPEPVTKPIRAQSCEFEVAARRLFKLGQLLPDTEATTSIAGRKNVSRGAIDSQKSERRTTSDVRRWSLSSDVECHPVL